MLWWVFRTRIVYLLFALAVLGLLLQIFLSGNADLAAIADRLQSADTGRTELWATYIPIGLESPVYGYSVSGSSRALAGEGLADLISQLGGSTTRFTAFHNAYLAMFFYFGGVGLGLMLLLLGISIRRAWRVIKSRKIPIEEKKIYIFPATVMVVIAVEALVEDIISATGKGTFVGLMYFCSLIICETHGRRLQEQYEVAEATKGKSIRTEARAVLPDKTLVT
jgi:O-antigen ligase